MQIVNEIINKFLTIIYNNIINNLQPRQVIINENDIKAIHEMFPTFEESLIKTLLETNEGDNEKTINMLLHMSSEN